MLQHNMQQSTLLKLPTEIRSLIWEYAFAHTDISLYMNTGMELDHPGSPQQIFGSDCSECDECMKTSLTARNPHELSCKDRWYPHRDMHQLPWDYRQKLEPLLTCKMIYVEAIGLFQSTMTLHVKSSEVLAFIRSSAPSQLRERITRIVLYIHFQDQNEMAWYMRLIELNRILPGLKHIAINYHMAAPLSYAELADAICMSMPLFALDPPFNKPLYVATSQSRSRKCSRLIDGRTVPSTDPRHGLTIHTAYKTRDVLFSSELLGDVSTDDVIDEHTLVVRSLFEDPAYIAAATTFIASDTYHDRWKRYAAWEFPRTEVPGEIISIRGGRALYDAIEQISHRYERPWFERLQKKKIVELYVERFGMARNEAEARLERTLVALGGDEYLTELLTSLIPPVM